MDSRTVREEQDALSLPAGPSGVMMRGLRDSTLLDRLKKRREIEELDAQKEERKQVLESLQQRIDEMHKKAKELHSHDMFVKEDADQATEKAEWERKDGLRKEAEKKRLKEEYAELMERYQELQRQVQRHSVYPDFMEQVVKMTKFKDMQSLTGHVENFLYLRDKLCQRENEAQEQVDQQRKALLTLNDQQHLLQMHMNNQLSQLQIELEKTRSEALIWEKKWKHIQETAVKKKLLLGQIKLATLNLYEATDDKVEGEEGVDMIDTEKQLDKIKIAIQDYSDIMKWHQTSLQKQKDGQKRKDQNRNTAQKSIATHCKKD